MATLVVIPARMGSSRFPGKPMEKICGMPMIGHCLRRAELAEGIDAAYVATCDQVIPRSYHVGFGYKLPLGRGRKDDYVGHCSFSSAERGMQPVVVISRMDERPRDRAVRVELFCIPARQNSSQSPSA